MSWRGSLSPLPVPPEGAALQQTPWSPWRAGRRTANSRSAGAEGADSGDEGFINDNDVEFAVEAGGIGDAGALFDEVVHGVVGSS